MHAISWYSFLFYIPGLTSLIQRDELILEFARSLLYKIKDEEDRRNSDMWMIRTKVRMLGRMVAEVQGRTSPAYLLSDMLHPRIFDHVVEAVDALTNQSPQLGKQLPCFVKEVARLKVGLGTRLENSLGEEMVHEAEKFLKLYDASWSRQVLRRADRKIKVRRLAQPKELPLSEDVNNISVWLKKTLAEA